jgi:lipoprotein LprG
MFRTRYVAPLLLAGLFAGTLLVASGCSHSSKGGTANLPPASQLLAEAAAAMATVQTVHVTIDAQGPLAGLTVHHADGDLTRDGKAQGTATIDQAGSTVEMNFIVVGSSLYLKGATGGYQTIPLALASTIYDPTAILDPNRGVVKLLSSATNPRTESLDQVDGQAAYRIAVTPDPAVLAALVPGASGGATGEVWVNRDTHRLVKAVFTLPGDASASTPGPSTVTIKLSNYDAAVSISAP